jgi:thiol-disulfide isomerase/thioredoxin
MARNSKALRVKSGLLIPIALAALLPPSRGDQPVATAKIAEWAASERGGRADYQELSHGQAINIDSLACPGKITIVDFSSDYCAPCVQLAMYLIRTSKNYPQRYAIRRVNVNRPGVVGIDWQSPVSKQFHLESLPRLVIYDNKVKVAEGDAARQWIIDDVNRMFARSTDAREDREAKKDSSAAPQ